jgi:hypothetical protein
MLKSFKKLRGRTLGEIRDRARSRSEAALERLGLSAKAKLPATRDLFLEFGLNGNESDQMLSDYFLAKLKTGFFRSFDDIELTTETYKLRFPVEVTSVVERANRICDGRFDLLGYKDLGFGEPIPCWHLDAVSNATIPSDHWSAADFKTYSRIADLKVVWELNRHQFFNILGRAYLLTGNEKYSEAFVRQLDDWFDSNRPKVGINWTSSLEIAFRSISWIWAVQFLKTSRSLSSDFLVRLLKHLFLQARHIETYLSTYSSPNTHLTGEGLALYLIGNLFVGTECGDRWKSRGYQIMMDALDFQVRPDGSYCEQTSHYHRYTVDFYINLFVLRQVSGEPIEKKHRDKLQKLCDFLLYTSSPRGHISLYGDDDGGRLGVLDERAISDIRGTLAIAAVMFERGDFKSVGNSPSGELLWLLGAEGLSGFDELETHLPSKTSKAFFDGGVFVMRDSWEEESRFLLVHCGEHGFLNGGHAHADALSFVMSLCGEDVFVDSGTYKYESERELRRYFRSGAAHNCLIVNGESSSKTGGPWDWDSVAESKLINWSEGENVLFRGSHDGFKSFGVEYEREIVFDGSGYIRVSEFIKSSRQNRYIFSFILSDHLSATTGCQQVQIMRKDSASKAFLTIGTQIVGDQVCDHAWAVEPCNISRCYGSLSSTTKLVLSIDAIGEFEVHNTFKNVSRETKTGGSAEVN